VLYRYSVFNLGICSEIPFPQLINADLSPDVYIHVGHVEPLKSGLIIKSPDYRVDGDEIYFKLKRVLEDPLARSRLLEGQNRKISGICRMISSDAVSLMTTYAAIFGQFSSKIPIAQLLTVPRQIS